VPEFEGEDGVSLKMAVALFLVDELLQRRRFDVTPIRPLLVQELVESLLEIRRNLTCTFFTSRKVWRPSIHTKAQAVVWVFLEGGDTDVSSLSIDRQRVWVLSEHPIPDGLGKCVVSIRIEDQETHHVSGQRSSFHLEVEQVVVVWSRNVHRVVTIAVDQSRKMSSLDVSNMEDHVLFPHTSVLVRILS
jgi:hypothetical protein